jgi:RNA ligase
MQLDEYLDVAELEASIEAGWVRVVKHSELPLTLYTYAELAQFDAVWNDATRKCRGLVVDSSGEIVAFCMPKFFNYSEYVNGKSYAQGLPLTEDFQIFSKMDGSMATVFFYAGEWHVATKGSFHSDQAVWATKYLRDKIITGCCIHPGEGNAPDCVWCWFNPLLVDYTYVCEIIYPDNRIVVDYGSREDLVLITSYWNLTGEEVLNQVVKNDWNPIGSSVPEFEPQGVSLDDLQTMADVNILFGEGSDYDETTSGIEAEGYVIRFSSGTRCKIKLGDYLRLHKVLTGCTERTIWEVVSQGLDLYGYLENVPDEFRDWVISVNNSLIKDVYDYIDHVNETFDNILKELDFNRDHLPVAGEYRKEFALLVASKYNLVRPGLFFLLDQNNKKLEELAWKLFKPAATKPFAADS